VAIALDASTPAAVTSSGASTTTAAFTPPSASILLACVSADANNGSSDETVSVSDSASGTWNQAILQNANGGAVSAIFWRLVPTSPGSITVSCTDNKGSVAKRLRVQVWTGTDQTNPIGATGQSTTAAVSYTSTVDQSQGVSCGLTANATLTAGGTGNTLDDETGGFDSGDATFVLIRSALTTPAGSTVTLTIAGTSTIGHHVAVELVPPAAATNYAGPWTGPTPGRIGPTGQWTPPPVDTSPTSAAVALADAGSSAEAVTVAAAACLADTGSSAEALAVTAAVPVTDAGASAEALTVAVAVPLADAGSTAEALSVAAAVALADAGSAADTLVAGIAISPADAGTSAETLASTAAVPLADTGAAAQTLAITAAAGLGDAGTAVDTLAVVVTVALTDAGAGADVGTGSNSSSTPKTLTEAGAGVVCLCVHRVQLRPNAGTVGRPNTGTVGRPSTGTVGTDTCSC